jgi:hypothetical protein
VSCMSSNSVKASILVVLAAAMAAGGRSNDVASVDSAHAACLGSLLDDVVFLPLVFGNAGTPNPAEVAVEAGSKPIASNMPVSASIRISGGIAARGLHGGIRMLAPSSTSSSRES